METDIALNIACYDFRVVLKDVNNIILEITENKIRKNLRMYKMMLPELKTKNIEDILCNISFCTD